MASHHPITVAPGQSVTIRLRLTHARAGRAGRSLRASVRPDLRRPKARRRRVLRQHHRPRRSSADAASVIRQGYSGLLWTKQAYVYDVERWLNQRGVEPRLGRRDPEPALVPHVQRRRHLDAGQVGVSLVRGLGSRLPRRVPGVRRPGLRPRPARADAARSLSAPERAAAGLRVELRRRQPARPRLGGLVQLPAQSREHGRRRHSVPQADLPHAGLQLHLVAQPEGSRRAATCSRAAFSASTTSASSIAARPCPRADTSSRPTAPPGWPFYAQNMLDIALELALVDPAYETSGRQVLRARGVDRGRREPQRCDAIRCGTRRTASSTTSSACPGSSRRASR